LNRRFSIFRLTSLAVEAYTIIGHVVYEHEFYLSSPRHKNVAAEK